MSATLLLDSAFDPEALERQHPGAAPGLVTTSKYTAVEGEPPYVRISEYESLAALRSAIEGHRASQRDTTEAMPGIPAVQRQIYASRGEDFSAPGAALGSRTYVVASAMSVREDCEQDLNAWYLEEHIPGLLKIDGWLRSRRFGKVAGTGPRHLALHDLRDLELRKQPAFTEIMTTPWRLRLVEVRTAYDRSLLKIDEPGSA